MTQPNLEQRELEAAEELVDRISAQIREQQPDPKMVEQAAQRVWQQMSRRGMKLVKEGDPRPVMAEDSGELAKPTNLVDFTSRRTNRFGLGRAQWVVAATLAAALGVAYWVSHQFGPANPLATVQMVDTQLFQVEKTAHLPLQVGSTFEEGDLLRTGRDGGAKLVLADGSEIEMSPRAELSIDESRKGTTIELERGSVIVHAAKQRNKHLYVQTKDCLVSVTGTIFSVNHGTKGSRVSVIEGEVHVDHQGNENILHPGDQVTTTPALSQVPVEKEIAWSRDFDRYVALLAEAHALQKEIEERVPHADLRYESQLLDLMPADTVLYGAMPNVPAVIGQMNEVVQERIATSPVLKAWWEEQDGEARRHFEEALALFTELGDQLGAEVAVGIYLQNDDPGLAVLAEIRDAAGLQALLTRHLQELPPEARDHLRLVEDPAAMEAVPESLYVWMVDDLAVATSDLDHLREIARFVAGEQNSFIGSDFYQSIAALYAEGAEFLVAANLDGVVRFVQQQADQGPDADTREVFGHMGIDNARHLLMEQKKVGNQTHQRGVLTFTDERQGIMAWLAPPAPMGSLQFISPDANLVAAAVLKDPARLFDDIAAMSESGLPAALTEFEQRYGLSVREDFMGTIGGEIALALDGPLVPKPAFKLILEVYDPARFQWALEQALAEVNRQQAENTTEPSAPLTIERREKSGHVYYTLPTKAMSLHYTFAEGYLVMAADPALLDQALSFAASDYSIVNAEKFRSLLPQDGRSNLSALVYQDLAKIVGPLAEQLGDTQLSAEAKAQLALWQEEATPSLAYAYGESDRLIFAASSHGDVLSSLLLTTLGLKTPTGMESLLSFGRFFEQATNGDLAKLTAPAKSASPGI